MMDSATQAAASLMIVTMAESTDGGECAVAVARVMAAMLLMLNDTISEDDALKMLCEGAKRTASKAREQNSTKH